MSAPGPWTRERHWMRRCSNKNEKRQLLNTVVKKGKSKRGRVADGEREADCCRVETAAGCMVSIKESFSGLSDPRVNRRRRHLLIDIVVIAVCAVICGAESWKDMHLWGKAREGWLRQFLELPNGIPSRDTFRRVISRLNPSEFQKCFAGWVRALGEASGGRIVAIDGKTLRRSMDRSSGKGPLHMVSAWASEQHISLGQLAVDSKSNEITAIPQVLELLELEGAFVTIDAMGCQKEIARQIVARGGDYCLAVKGNQGHLREDLEEHFVGCLENGFEGVCYDHYKESERAHGRVEEREYYTTDVPKELRGSEQWKGLKSVGLALRRSSESGKVEARYYIMSIGSNAAELARASRQHWGIENSLHWVLDVTFNEDQSRIRKEHGAENFSWLRRFAITLLKNEPTVQDTVRAKGRRAMWDTGYLEQVLVAAIGQN